jgi:hypothetical protein
MRETAIKLAISPRSHGDHSKGRLLGVFSRNGHPDGDRERR